MENEFMPEKTKAQIRRYLSQLWAFNGLLFNEYGKQPTWEVWEDSCSEISRLAENLFEKSCALSLEYHKANEELEKDRH